MKKDTIIALTQAEGIDNGVGVAYYRLTKEMKEFLETGKDYIFKFRSKLPKTGFLAILSAYLTFLPTKCND